MPRVSACKHPETAVASVVVVVRASSAADRSPNRNALDKDPKGVNYTEEGRRAETDKVDRRKIGGGRGALRVLSRSPARFTAT